MTRVEVILHNTATECVSATRATLLMAPLCAALVEEDGRFYIVGSEFAIFAAERQGYVKKILRDVKL